MLLKYFYDDKLAHASYLVGCQATGEALIIDPGRDIAPYQHAAEANGMRIVGVAETHIHADFVSGARELAEQAGATLYLSDEGDEQWKYRYLAGYAHRLLREGDHFHAGRLRLEVLHTPGHTPEHLSFVLTDASSGADRPMGIFTGDFVFVGAAGRPDLLEKAVGITGTAVTGAQAMFHSLQRFKQLPDYWQVWPGHGAGSVCGKGLGSIPSSTVGYEKLFNPALAYADEAAFVAYLLADQPESPPYFARMKQVNKDGPPLLHRLPAPTQLPTDHLPVLLAGGAQVVDTRPSPDFAAEHLPGTLHIPVGMLVAWVGWFVSYDRPLYLMVDAPQLPGVLRDLASIGLDQIAGYFDTAVIQTLAQQGTPMHAFHIATPAQIAPRIMSGDVLALDVRSQSEWDERHIPGAHHIMLGYLPDRLPELADGRAIAVICEAGRRSAIAASILRNQGFTEVISLQGGLHDWAQAGFPIVPGR